MARILLIEDDRAAAAIEMKFLKTRGHDVTVAHDGETGLCIFDGGTFDLVILDLVLPKIDGLVLCRIFRSRDRYVPIIMLTGRSDIGDKVLGYETGADEYLAKPVSLEELLAKVKALLRLVERVRAAEKIPAGDMLRVGHLLLDIEKRTASKDGTVIPLTAREFDLLAFMARNPGKVFSRPHLLREVWGYKHECYMHTVDSHVNRLRNKIEDNSAKPDILLTVWGVGYKLNESPAH
ncbi:MAG TPA: response regulator transcription factor [Geobacteraceae bacterium]